MIGTPLQLERSFFAKVHIEANPDYLPGQSDEQQGDIEITVSLNVGQHQQDPNRYQVRLSIDKLEGNKTQLPYIISLQIVGLFQVDEAFKADNIKHLVEINGASMLYSAAREQVLSITGRGPWGAFQLPTINFHNQNGPESESSEPS
ncbi:protein-export chaperone SecB [Salinicola sp. MIT1003]|jgi:preprotein translocase subunit SecB|uniref:protein-export chaperone SecB n=1 Tax=Salinicola sp. MIT1003 TaxID=1882734 RepID=UPI0008DDB7BC|nr:protein-export chaperone SecB [Salinicola sp. MIT1003]OHZ01195.1 hypothetical protein BC443_12300 [Salinicola sp. MIT1003]